LLTGADKLYVCEAGDATFLGEYLAVGEQDGVSKYENDEGKSIWRHQVGRQNGLYGMARHHNSLPLFDSLMYHHLDI